MNAAPSRYLNRLEAEIAQAGDTIEADCLRAEKAGYLARQGRLGEARGLIGDIRQRRAARPDLSLTAWLSLAEGLVSYFSSIEFGARDRFLRAQALAGSAGLKRIDAICSAWLAQLDYSRLDPRSMAANVERSLSCAAADNHFARTRASLVMAEALHYARRFDLAAPWYRKARLHAAEDGDDSAISALLHNMAWLRMGSLRQAVCCGEAPVEDASLVWLGGESMRSFDALIGSVSFKELDPLLQAETLSLEGRPADALALYREHIADIKLTGVSRWLSVFLADRSWCHAQTGASADAAADAMAAEEALCAETQIDDRAATHSWLSKTYRQLGDVEKAASHEKLAQASWLEVTSLQAEFVALASSVRT